MSTYRIVVCLDIEATSAVGAYRTLHRAMPALAREGIDSESTDEWYGEDGDERSLKEIERAHRVVLGTAPPTRHALRVSPTPR